MCVCVFFSEPKGPLWLGRLMYLLFLSVYTSVLTDDGGWIVIQMFEFVYIFLKF